MATRYIGDAVVRVQVDEQTITMGPRVGYKGSVSAGGYTWRFAGLSINVWNKAADSPEMYDRAAASAVGFGSYYTSSNRGSDTPEWAPAPEVADAIDEAVASASNDVGQYFVQRRPGGKGRFAEEKR